MDKLNVRATLKCLMSQCQSTFRKEDLSIRLHKAVIEVNMEEVSDVEVSKILFVIVFRYHRSLPKGNLHFRASKS